MWLSIGGGARISFFRISIDIQARTEIFTPTKSSKGIGRKRTASLRFGCSSKHTQEEAEPTAELRRRLRAHAPDFWVGLGGKRSVGLKKPKESKASPGERSEPDIGLELESISRVSGS